MPVVKGGVWTNIEDEILKSAVSKYGLNQWARVSSLLARKTPKQCKARWNEWLDPGIRKIEWSKEEDEKLLHLAKLMPTQWRTIAPLVGRTATQCLERYQRLLDEAEQKESGELGLGGPEGGESKAPTADDIRRLRPGEVDPDPESKPARPDTVDLDEDEKEMLSEARARLANTQGKKAKRKARERQLEESRRLAVLQKRRELKNAGINIKVVNRKKGEMDYNADIPFEKKAAPGFYETEDESIQNEREREAFDPRKQQLANKRKGDQEDDPDRKRQKNEKNAPSASYTAALKAGQMQKIREAEQSSKRRALVLPSPQVGEGELEEIVKMGMIGERANIMARSSENDATRGLVNTYSTINSGAPIRTPKAPAQEDYIANEIRNIRALTETQSSLLGGENTPLHEGAGSTGFEGVTPRTHKLETPNPMATPFRQGNAPGATPMGPPALPGATPMRTPRDTFALNTDDGDMDLVGGTPRDIKLREMALKHKLRHGLSSLPKPKDAEWELELPEEQQEALAANEISEEDAAIRDLREKQIREAEEKLDFQRRTQVVQRNLPRPSTIDIDAILKNASAVSDPISGAIEREAALLVANDALKYPLPGAKVKGTSKALEKFDDEALANARLVVTLEVPRELAQEGSASFQAAWADAQSSSLLPGLGAYDDDDEIDEYQALAKAFDVSTIAPSYYRDGVNCPWQNVQDSIVSTAERGMKLEKKLALHLGGYQQRAKMLRQKISEASDALNKATFSLDSFRTLQISEEAAIARRLDGLRSEVEFVSRREREAQDLYKARKEELISLSDGTNGYH
jgi:pre-mRNA-splicing factor CDC5/CEF1